MLECSSTVSRVVVHARGALVTRDVTLPDLPRGIVDVSLPGITAFARPGSARAKTTNSERTIVAVRAELVVPAGVPARGHARARLRALVSEQQHLADQHRTLLDRRGLLASIELGLPLKAHDGGKRARDAFDVRFGEAMRITSMLKEKVSELDTRLATLEGRRLEIERELERVRLEDRQASSQENARASRNVVVRLAGEGRAGNLQVTYAVMGARWWPAYTLRIAGADARWIFEAIVAQNTGEDWTGVELALSSADLVFDARLPELPSLRFGRAQVAKKRPLREPPKGVDGMFASYLAFQGPPPPPIPAPFAEEIGILDEEPTMVTDMLEAAAADAPSVDGFGGGPPPTGGFAPPPRHAMRFQAAPMQKPASTMAFAAPGAFAQGALPKKSRGFGGFFAGAENGAPPMVGEPELVAGDEWNDHDALVLAGAEAPTRGRLVPHRDAYEAAPEIASVPEGSIDPAESRGMFDHRYDAGGRADIPSDGRVHRVAVADAACPVKLAWRAVPSETLEVFREAQITNPFATGLLGGPADVYLDGSLLASTTVERIDRGGTIWVGMGADDRIKVVRNVRADEESAGLLGGSTAVTHTVSIELSSSVRDPISVTVLERVPVSDDKSVEIKVLRGGEAYDQADRGTPVRGGQRFVVRVDPKAKSTVELVYRLVFPQKLEIVGGNRRD